MLTVSNYGTFQFFVDMDLSALTCFRRLNFIKHDSLSSIRSNWYNYDTTVIYINIFTPIKIGR